MNNSNAYTIVGALGQNFIKPKYLVGFITTVILININLDSDTLNSCAEFLCVVFKHFMEFTPEKNLIYTENFKACSY